MKRRITLSIILLLLLLTAAGLITVVPVYAADNTKQIINAIGIMDTDQGSNGNGTQIVSRARFAQMLVNASSLKNTISGKSNVSLYSDVKKNYWASGYIQAVITQGWMSGYLNGKFKPSQGVSLQEAVRGIVNLLGYNTSDFTGGVSEGFMNLYRSKGLNKNISKTKTEYLTVNDCYHLFYNLLTATTKAGKNYAETLGLTVDSNGIPSYSSVVSSGMKGPIVVDENWKDELPFTTAQATFYKDGAACSQADIHDYDVLYYSESLKSVWIYDNKVTGTVESINPDYMAPQSVTISGKTYSFTDSEAASKFSDMGTVKKGAVVTLILDKENKVADVLSIDEYNTTITGVVLGTGSHVVESNGSYTSSEYVTFVDAAGNEYQQDYNKTLVFFQIGDLVRLSFIDGIASISHISTPSFSFGNNTLSSNGSYLGDLKLASNVKMLDLNGTDYISIYPERLENVSISSSSVYYYELNASGELSQLILCDVTGDLDKYGIFTGITFQGTSSKYNYIIGQESGSLTTNNVANLSLDKGPMGFYFTDKVLTKSYALNYGDVTSIGTNTILIGNTKYTLAEGYYVYLYTNGEYILTTLNKVSDLTKYQVKAYYDRSISSGGRIRIIVAEMK